VWNIYLAVAHCQYILVLNYTMLAERTGEQMSDEAVTIKQSNQPSSAKGQVLAGQIA